MAFAPGSFVALRRWEALLVLPGNRLAAIWRTHERAGAKAIKVKWGAVLLDFGNREEDHGHCVSGRRRAYSGLSLSPDGRTFAQATSQVAMVVGSATLTVRRKIAEEPRPRLAGNYLLAFHNGALSPAAVTEMPSAFATVASGKSSCCAAKVVRILRFVGAGVFARRP